MEMHSTRPGLVIFTDFTPASHLLFGEALKNEYADFRIRVLRGSEWASWHSRLSGPYPKGWCIRKANLEELVAALKASDIPFEMKEHPRAHSKVSSSKPSLHPSFKVMICKAIREQKDHKGSSRVAIKKYILANYHVSEKIMASHFNYYLKRLVTKGYLKPVYGNACFSSRFKVTDKLSSETKTRKRPKNTTPVLPVGSIDNPKDTEYIQKWVEWAKQAPNDRAVIYQFGNAYHQIITIINGDDRKTYVGPEDGTVAKIAWNQYHAKKIDEALLED